MQAGKFVVALAAGVTLLSCSNTSSGGGGTGSGFQTRYNSARTALEAGNYRSAIGSYEKLLGSAGPLESRVRLELSHALLRANRYQEASDQANIVAVSHEDTRRAAALAVRGTAQHRMAQDAMSKGDFGPNTIAHLRIARASLDEMLREAPELDPLGSMATRRKMVDASLRNLGG